MSRPIRPLFLTMTLLLSTQACGESGQSTATLAPLIDDLPTTTASATLTATDVAVAEDAWKRTSALFTGLYTKTPFISGTSIYSIAALSDLRPSDVSIYPSSAVLMVWENQEWTPIDQFDSGCLDAASCEISVMGDRQLAQPVLVIAWCCPADLTPLRFPVAIILQVIDNQLTDFITPERVSPDFSSHFVSLDNPNEMRLHECLERTEYGPGEYPNAVICNHKVETLYRLGDDGTWSVETSETFAKTPINECLIDPPVGCQQEVYIEPSDACPDPVRNDSRFPIRPCQYGTWMLYFEQSISDLGYAVDADGYYDSNEVPTIRQLQRDFGLDPDGLIGPRTWGATQPYWVCTPEDRSLDIPGPCTDDHNGDGVYGPGDIIPH